MNNPVFSSLGDSFLILDFGNTPGRKITQDIVNLFSHWERLPLRGIFNIIPSVCSIGIHYNPLIWADPDAPGTAYSNLVDKITEDMMFVDGKKEKVEGKMITIPVTYGGKFGRDFEEVVGECGLSRDEFIAIHTAKCYTVYMIGFAPGFPYLGPLDNRLLVSRRSRPREKVPAGSVAIASGMTGVYPGEYPGGWNLIGRTPMKMFDILQEDSSRLTIGDQVKFYPIDETDFQTLEAK